MQAGEATRLRKTEEENAKLKQRWPRRISTSKR
jgi:hypothetical protein